MLPTTDPSTGLPPEPPSLKRLLAVWLLVPLLLLVPVAAGLQYWLTLRPALNSLDHGLGDAALALANLLHVDRDGGIVFDLAPQTERSLRTDRDDRVYYAVLDPDGRRVAGDPALAGLNVVTESPRSGAARYENYGDARIEGEPVRIAVYRTPCGAGECEVRVAETTHKRQHAQRDAVLAAFASMLVLALLLIVLMMVAIDRALRPLVEVHDELARRSLDNLDPIESTRAPAEVQPLLQAINRLFVRLRGAAQTQQAFIADAAHQLRTPRTALRTEAELALLEPHPPALTPTLRRLAGTSERASRVAAQLLSLARADAPSTQPSVRVDLRTTCGEAAQEWVPRALSAGVDLGFDLEPAAVSGQPLLLQELLANLLHNAIEYAGRGARVTVRTRSSAAGALLEVEDDGPGIPPADRDRVLARFERGSQARGHGSGLGLAIVRDIAAAHAGEVRLLDPPGGRGLLVQVQFPPLGPA
jgi:two-component system sensor histidine kinase TctE